MKTNLITLSLLLCFALFNLSFAEEKKDATQPQKKQPPTPAEFQAKKPFPRVNKSQDQQKEAAVTVAKHTSTTTKNIKKIELENAGFAKKVELNKWNIAEALGSNSDLSMLHALLKDANLLKTLKSGEYTLFAPTNEALEQIPVDEFLSFGKDKEKLKNVLLFHLAKGTLSTAEALKRNGEYSPMMNGATAVIIAKQNTVMLNQSKVKYSDIQCTNGVIHIIDQVLSQEKTTLGANQHSPVKKIAKVDENSLNVAPAIGTTAKEKK